MANEVELFDDLDAVAADAAGALDRAAQLSLFDRLDWFRLTRAFVWRDAPLLVARARSGDAGAWLFLRDEGRGRAAELGSWYTLAFAPVFAGGTSAEHRLLLAAIARRLRRRLAGLSLAPLGTSASALLEQGFRAGGWLVWRTDATVNWTVDVMGLSFADFWGKRPSRLRTTIGRKRKQAALSCSIFKHFDPDAWSAYEEVYRASWKPEEGSPAFLRALAEQEGEAGTLRLAVARRDGVPVAAQLWTVESGRAIIHKLAHVEAARQFSPGSLLSEAMFREVIENDRPHIIDFGTGDDPYKADWMDERHPLFRVDAWNPRRPAGLAGAARRFVSALVRARRND